MSATMKPCWHTKGGGHTFDANAIICHCGATDCWGRPTQKQAIVAALDTLEHLMEEYVNELAPKDRLEARLRFSTFLAWVRRRQLITKETTTNET